MRAFLTLATICFLTACGSGPADNNAAGNPLTNENSTGVFTEPAEMPQKVQGKDDTALDTDLHAVVVKEVLEAENYIYLRVDEYDEEYWVATTKMDVTVGEAYYFQQALLKTNFHSEEHNRDFEKLYMVAQFIPVSDIDKQNQAAHSQELTSSEAPQAEVKNVVVEGSMRIADLVKNAHSLEGKSIQVSGVVTKVNRGILGYNWVHLKDGSLNDFDLVITTQQEIAAGGTTTMTATLALNRDFGAGYKYEIILEDGQEVK